MLIKENYCYKIHTALMKSRVYLPFYRNSPYMDYLPILQENRESPGFSIKKGWGLTICHVFRLKGFSFTANRVLKVDIFFLTLLTNSMEQKMKNILFEPISSVTHGVMRYWSSILSILFTWVHDTRLEKEKKDAQKSYKYLKKKSYK